MTGEVCSSIDSRRVRRSGVPQHSALFALQWYNCSLRRAGQYCVTIVDAVPRQHNATVDLTETSSGRYLRRQRRWQQQAKGILTNMMFRGQLAEVTEDSRRLAFRNANLDSTVQFVSIGQVIGCEDRLRNDLHCVGWGVKLCSTSTSTVQVIQVWLRSEPNRISFVRVQLRTSWRYST